MGKVTMELQHTQTALQLVTSLHHTNTPHLKYYRKHSSLPSRFLHKSWTIFRFQNKYYDTEPTASK